MRRKFALILLVAGTVFAQTSNRPSFVAAQIQPSRHMTRPQVMGPFYGGGQYELKYATLVDLIQIAYGVDPDRVYGGPNWVEYDRFDIVAKTPAGSNAEARKLMLQSLLADRFQLTLNVTTRDVMGYKLTAPKSKLQESDGSGPQTCDFKIQQNAPPPPPPPPPGSEGQLRPAMTLPVISYTCRNTSMASFVAALPNIPGTNQYFGNKPLVDQTELKGNYDFTIKYTPSVPAAMAVTGESIPINDAVDKQLGLKLETGAVPVPAVTMEKAAKPGPDAPDTAKLFPPPPTEFDVAELKPVTAPQPNQVQAPSIQNGRLIVTNLSLTNLIQVAFNGANGGSNDNLIGIPKWADTEFFDLIAKAPDGVQIGDMNFTGKSIPLNIDALVPMIKALMVKSFKIQYHTEERTLTAFTLTAAKPKMQPADPNTRTKWVEGMTIEGKPLDKKDKTDPRNANPALGRLITCQNVTMAQFADMLPNIASGYIRTDVQDLTGLEGGWNFTLSFSGAGQVMGGGRGGDASQAGPGSVSASDPSGGISLQDAMLKQLGLKLEEKKRSYQVFVFDHIEQKPTDN